MLMELLIIAQKWEQLKYAPTDEWITKYNIPYNAICSNTKKRSANIFYNMDESWKHAKYKMPDTKVHKLHNSIYVKYPE